MMGTVMCIVVWFSHTPAPLYSVPMPVQDALAIMDYQPDGRTYRPGMTCSDTPGWAAALAASERQRSAATGRRRRPG
jgi:hypothetical protein